MFSKSADQKKQWTSKNIDEKGLFPFAILLCNASNTRNDED